MDADAADALQHCYREAPVDPQAVDWAAGRLIDGADLASLTDELAGHGWADAEAIVEAARVLTRRERGVVTRDDVVGDLDFRYRRSTGGMTAFYKACGGPVGFFAFLTGLRGALVALLRLRRLSRANRAGTAAGRP